MPKGYQTSQYEQPICEHGSLEGISIQRIHMEEDAGKSVHEGDHSVVNLNRAGVPLVEIVSGPDIRSSEQAGQYLRALHAIVTYLGICDGNMQEGNFRCDANVSIRPKGSKVLGTRTEIKNVNSFKFVEKAIDYEIARQSEVVRAGGKIIQETRLFDPDRGVTESMRSKEEAQDYRYFPDPDLIALNLEPSWIEEIRASLPELPAQKRARFESELGLSAYDAGVLTASKSLAAYFEAAVALGAAAKPAANFLTGEIARRLNDEGIEIPQSKLRPEHLAELVSLTASGAVSSTGAKQALNVAFKTGDAISAIVEREGLKQVSDVSALEPVVAEVIAANPAQAADLKAGKDKLMGFFVGQLMKKTGGKANPALLQELIKKKLLE